MLEIGQILNPFGEGKTFLLAYVAIVIIMMAIMFTGIYVREDKNVKHNFKENVVTFTALIVINLFVTYLIIACIMNTSFIGANVCNLLAFILGAISLFQIFMFVYELPDKTEDIETADINRVF